MYQKTRCIKDSFNSIWTASSEFDTYGLCEQQRFRRACASAQSRQNLRCSLIQAVSQEEPSDRKPDPWPLWMAGHAQLKFVMTECSKTQIRLMGLIYCWWWHVCRLKWICLSFIILNFVKNKITICGRFWEHYNPGIIIKGGRPVCLEIQSVNIDRHTACIRKKWENVRQF